MHTSHFINNWDTFDIFSKYVYKWAKIQNKNAIFWIKRFNKWKIGIFLAIYAPKNPKNSNYNSPKKMEKIDRNIYKTIWLFRNPDIFWETEHCSAPDNFWEKKCFHNKDVFIKKGKKNPFFCHLSSCPLSAWKSWVFSNNFYFS